MSVVMQGGDGLEPNIKRKGYDRANAMGGTDPGWPGPGDGNTTVRARTARVLGTDPSETNAWALLAVEYSDNETLTQMADAEEVTSAGVLTCTTRLRERRRRLHARRHFPRYRATIVSGW